MSVSPEEFRNECARQGVKFAPKLDMVLEGQPYNGLAGVVQDISGALRKDVSPLANKPIDGVGWVNDTAAKTLKGVINGTVQPVENASLAFSPRSVKTISACGYAETSFTRIISRMAEQTQITPSYRNYDGRGFQVFTHEGSPVFLRKSMGEPSALSLTDVTINGVPYPGGSIMRLDTDQDLAERYPYVDPYEVNELDVKELVGMAFVRLSLLAFEPYERPELAGKWVYKNDFMAEEWRLLMEGTVADVQRVARESIVPVEPPARRGARG